MSPAPLLRVSLQAGYGQARVLEDVAFEVTRGEAFGLIGTSGAGKSTLVLALLGLLRWRGGHATGEVLFEGANLLALSERQARRLRGKRFAFVPQSPLSSLNSVLSLRTHFEQAWRAHEPYDRARLNARIRELFAQVMLPSDSRFVARRPGEISVGQAQRAMLALALLHRPSLVIADEPTSALDSVTQAQIVQLLRSLNREHGTSLLYISHDLLSVLQLCDRVAVLDQGRIAECLSADSIDETASHQTTRSLLRSLPIPAGVVRSYRESGSLRG